MAKKQRNTQQVDTIVFLMMENRSFDHVFGYLSKPPFSWTSVDGLKDDPAWLKKYTNYYVGPDGFVPFPLANGIETPLADDPPHDRNQIRLQMGALTNNAYEMNGFVRSYYFRNGISNPPEVMGYFSA